MPDFNLTLPSGRGARISGVRPFARIISGGGYIVTDANLDDAGARYADEGAVTVFALHDNARADVDALVTAANNSPLNTVAPTITGTAQVGQVLTANATFTGTPAPTLTYRWFAGGVVIEGETAATFTPTAAEQGDAITVEVTGTSTNGYAVATSAATAAVAAAV